MPELPEVEVVKRSLQRDIINLTIKNIEINNVNLRYKVKKKEFYKLIKSKVISISRRSKYLLINLSGQISIIVHLGMTGKFFITNSKKKIKKLSFYYLLDDKKNKHDHLIFKFNKNIKLIYNDVRRFGFIKIIKTVEINNISHFKLLGPEPMSDDFNNRYFQKYILNKSRTIKDLLMDQKFVAGLGNIYVNEILFLSSVMPKKNIKHVSKYTINKLIKNTKQILKRSINLGGSSIKDFEDSAGKKGNFQQKFKVYGRERSTCIKYKCKSLIKKTYIANRATYYCPSCQK